MIRFFLSLMKIKYDLTSKRIDNGVLFEIEASVSILHQQLATAMAEQLV